MSSAVLPLAVSRHINRVFSRYSKFLMSLLNLFLLCIITLRMTSCLPHVKCEVPVSEADKGLVGRELTDPVWKGGQRERESGEDGLLERRGGEGCEVGKRHAWQTRWNG